MRAVAIGNESKVIGRIGMPRAFCFPVLKSQAETLHNLGEHLCKISLKGKTYTALHVVLLIIKINAGGNHFDYTLELWHAMGAEYLSLLGLL